LCLCKRVAVAAGEDSISTASKRKRGKRKYNTEKLKRKVDYVYYDLTVQEVVHEKQLQLMDILMNKCKGEVLNNLQDESIWIANYGKRCSKRDKRERIRGLLRFQGSDLGQPFTEEYLRKHFPKATEEAVRSYLKWTRDCYLKTNEAKCKGKN